MAEHTYRITNIHRNDRHPGNIYAWLVNEKGECEISATIDYILTAIKERGYNCETVRHGGKNG
jgi:hypothetical protein